MTTAVAAASEQADVRDNYAAPVDPEADAAEALKTLRQFVLDDVGSDADELEIWHGLEPYIEELCGYGVDKLSREPDELQAASLRLKNELEEVSCGNYRALIESFECAGAVRDGVADVRARLDQLVLALPRLADATRQFSANVNEKQRERERRLRAITEHRAVSDILEMPRLMRTLIAGELYDEALELRENAVKLATMHPDEKLICDVCSEMDILTQQMVLQLLVVLRNPVQLPMCLRVVGFLRRLGVFSEFRLRMLFLQCRGEWMRSGIESTVVSSQQAHLVHLSDSTRAMVFEIITQYRAVFNDDIDNEDDDGGVGALNGGDFTSYNHSAAILFDWTSSCVSEYLERLESGISEIRDGAALNTVMQQAMYCGQSLGRVGADFRAVLPPLFASAVLRIYNSFLNAALRQFEMMIEDNRWAPVGSSALRKDRGSHLPSTVKGANGGTSNDAEEGQTDVSSGEQYEPPIGVLDSPPLAVFLNGILAALNELRLCAPISLGPQLGSALQDTLIRAAMSASLRDLCVQHAARCLDHCMNQTGLVCVSEVHDSLTEVFGESLAPVVLNSETALRLNGTESAVGSEELGATEEVNAGAEEALLSADGVEGVAEGLNDLDIAGEAVPDVDVDPEVSDPVAVENGAYQDESRKPASDGDNLIL